MWKVAIALRAGGTKVKGVIPDPLSTALLKILSLLPNPKPGACILCLLLKD